MASKISLKDGLKPFPKLILGVDVSNNRFDPHQMIYAAAFMFHLRQCVLLKLQRKLKNKHFPIYQDT